MPTIKYKCVYCNQEHGTEQSALRCEENHKKPLGITGATYNHRHPKQGEYPSRVKVNFSNGTAAWYVKEG